MIGYQLSNPYFSRAAVTPNAIVQNNAMNDYRIFVVEDDPWYGEILAYHLSLNPDYIIHRFTTGAECLKHLHLRPNLITIDFSLPDMKGDELYKRIAETHNDIPVIIISSQENIAVAVKLLKMGVTDYLVKDENTKDVLWNSIIKIKETQSLREEVQHLRKELTDKYEFENIIKGQSPALKKVFALMQKATRTNINVSINGETGTGKELVAKAIHYNSDRKKKKFEAVNMAAIPKELIESELFGHEKGSFTGAVSRKLGKFEEANGGTIFLDEIAELDLSIQSKLLRVLQERELIRVGGNETIKLDIRIIAATHKNLAEEVRKGNFREDLYYRIIGMPIELPPLRERGNDILILAKSFADDYARENNLEKITLSNSAKDKLTGYYFPGNVRELKAMIELAVVMCNGEEIKADDIAFSATKASTEYISEEKTLREYNMGIIKNFLKRYDNDINIVAKKLDIGKSTIYKMIQNKELVLEKE